MVLNRKFWKSCFNFFESMNKFLTIIIILISSKSISQISNLRVRNLSNIVYDTLVFDDNIKDEFLKDKFESSKSRLNYYRPFINSKKINKLIILKEEFSKTKIKYLGKIEDLNNKESYHIITDFTIIGVGSMLSPRGKSNVIFINKNLDKIIIYNLPMPENLPLYIDNNVLFFNYEKTKIGISISGGLPPELCLPKIGCN